MNSKIELGIWTSEKLQPHHLERLAIVYVRQSTLQQVVNHQESTRLQYGLVHRAETLGWNRKRVLTIDDDLGKSGSSAEGRVGFQRLVTEVGLNHVGLILGIEMSRLARSSKDWHQLLEICALFGTLIADLDGIYDPSQYNDRLLLGLKGTMSEAELHILKQRLVQGKHAKAQRGELGFSVPIGYVRHPSGVVQFDPDEQAQQIVKLIFRKFEDLGTLHGVLRYLVTHQIQIGVRVLSGAHKGDLEWRRPTRATLQCLLKNPAYAGAYAYGRKQIDPRKKKAGRPRTGSVVQPPENWLVLIKDHHPAYIGWEQYQRNVSQLQSNRNRAKEVGVARPGTALLSGLLRCGKCGSYMMIHYPQKGHHQYVCRQEAVNYGGVLCQSLSGPCLDIYVSKQVLQALKPAALELALAATMHLEQDHLELNQLWQHRLERATFEAERAGRHYRLVEPENRLVARQLAQDWEAKLQAHQDLQQEYNRFCSQQSQSLSADEKQAIRQLAEDLPALWKAETTTQIQRKEIIRQVIQNISVNIIGKSEHAQVVIEWVGGDSTHDQITRPVAHWTQLSFYPQLCEKLEQCAEENLSTDEIIDCLHQAGFHPPKRRQTFNRQIVQTLMRRLSIGSHPVMHKRAALGENEWWLPDLAKHLEMPRVTLYHWLRRGWVKARQQSEHSRCWIVWADQAEVDRLKRYRQSPVGETLRQRWKGEVPDIAICPDGTEIPKL
ncbi:recombinase family protein [Acaryochloris marina]|uniref:recombinase family protein n=1 Tax=Acaryochloris marina TaxID=155978 RepID=UPI001BAE9C85|nr:recombinase family protein [Acaryochloris marina]QUY40343.1 recombinase family protein [Acaryochloris marina S15]QUY44835.1 recombinase family protein [Acaryochloris marina S15]